MKTKRFLSTTLIVSFFAFGFLQGCEKKADKKLEGQIERQIQSVEMERLKNELETQKKLQEKQAAERAAREAVRAIANAKRDLEKNPSKYIFSAGGCTHTESGIINVYTNIQACNFSNSSDFGICNLSGNLHVTAAKGTKVIPFRASGCLNARQTNMLPIVGIQKVQIPGKFVSTRIEVLKLLVENLREGG